MFLKLIRTATVTCCFLSIPSPGSLGQSISKQAAALLRGCSFSLFFHHKQKDPYLSMSAHSACTQVYMVALGSGLDSLMFHTASLLSHIFLQAWSAINDFFFFFTHRVDGTDWLEYEHYLFRRITETACCMANSKALGMAKKTTQAQPESPEHIWRTPKTP